VVKIAVKGATYRGIFASFIIFCIFGAVVAVIWYGSSLVSGGDISVGDLTTYILYSLFVAGSMGSFPAPYANILRAICASKRVIEILDDQQVDIGLLLPYINIANPIVSELGGVDILFDDPKRTETTVQKRVSVEAQAGEKLAIVGP